MFRRLKLQKELEFLLGSENVYFQPPKSIQLKYPAIVYSLNDIKSERANNGVYLTNKQYTVTLIDFNPDSIFINKIVKMPMCDFNRFYTSENLNHWVFSLYY